MAGLQGTDWREGLALEHANLVSWEGIKIQMNIFGYHRELVPVNIALIIYWGLTRNL